MKFTTLTLLLALACACPADAEADWQTETEHLLSYIEQSDCLFIRNGKSYSAAEAGQHIGKKYNYVKKRIESAEQFISYAATKSSITGEAYTVTCDGDTLPSKQWLEAELDRFRRSAANGFETAEQTETE